MLPKCYDGKNIAKACLRKRVAKPLPQVGDNIAAVRKPIVRLAIVGVVSLLRIALLIVFGHNRGQEGGGEAASDSSSVSSPGHTLDGSGNQYDYEDTAGRPSQDPGSPNGTGAVNDSDASESSSNGEAANQLGSEFDPDSIRGTWCRSDGVTCVKITPQTEGKAAPLVLDTSKMGDLNPLPNGQTTTLMGYYYQSIPNPSEVAQQLRLITQYSYRIDCGIYSHNPCDGETIHVADMTVGGAPGAGIRFVQEPLVVTRVSPTNELPVEGLDESDPPAHAAYLINEPYGVRAANSVSNSTVFYSHI